MLWATVKFQHPEFPEKNLTRSILLFVNVHVLFQYRLSSYQRAAVWEKAVGYVAVLQCVISESFGIAQPEQEIVQTQRIKIYSESVRQCHLFFRFLDAIK